MKIINRVDIYKLRGMCIKHDYYTEGCNEDYTDMLLRYRDTKDVTAEQIYDLARDIKEHSDTEEDEDGIAFDILREAVYQFIVK